MLFCGPVPGAVEGPRGGSKRCCSVVPSVVVPVEPLKAGLGGGGGLT